MSVLERKRKPSQYEFYVQALRLRKSMRFLLLRDLGVKDRVRSVREFAKDMSEEDKREFMELAERNHVERFKTNFPEWVITKLRDALWAHLDDMVDCVTSAYSIWPTSREEFQLRRCYMDDAICACQCIIKDLEGAIDILPVDAEKYLPFVEKVDEEIARLKGWRKNDNKRFKDFK